MFSADSSNISDYRIAFKGFCDIYQLPHTATRDKAMDAIIAKPNSQLLCFTQYKRLFEAFQNLVNKKIQLDQFMGIGDPELGTTQPINRNITNQENQIPGSDVILIIDRVFLKLHPHLKSNNPIYEL